MKKIKILFVTHHWKENTHQSEFSGYQRLVEFMSLDKIEPTLLTWGDEEKDCFLNGIHIIIKKISGFPTFIKKRRILSDYASKISADYDVIHALYDDVAPLKPKVPLITTFHTIKDLDKYSLWLKFKFINQLNVMKKSDKIIVLSTNMKEILSRYVNKSKIEIVPHGIDVEHFKPSSNLPSNLKNLKKRYVSVVLCIGNYGTDKNKVLNLAKKLKKVFFIVINKQWKIKNEPNILLFNRVSEKELIEFYNLADVLYRPLKFSSANNSILEALSMGLFIITNKTKGVKDYLNEKNSAYIENIKNLPSFLGSMQFKRRKRIRTLRFKWEIICKNLSKLYEGMLKK